MHEIVVGVTGGIAAYKTAALVSQLVQGGAGVTVVMTAAAERFIGAATFAALTGRPVARQTFDEAQFPLGAHITLAERPELLVVAPASADFLAKAAVQRNIAQLRADGVQFVEPGSGWLSCRQVGAGRMAEPEVILAAIQSLL